MVSNIIDAARVGAGVLLYPEDVLKSANRGANSKFQIMPHVLDDIYSEEQRLTYSGALIGEVLLQKKSARRPTKLYLVLMRNGSLRAVPKEMIRQLESNPEKTGLKIDDAINVDQQR